MFFCFLFKDKQELFQKRAGEVIFFQKCEQKQKAALKKYLLPKIAARDIFG